MAVAKKISEFGVCAFPLVPVLGAISVRPGTGKAGSVDLGVPCCALQEQHIISLDTPRRRCPPRDFPRCELLRKKNGFLLACNF